MQNTQVLGFYIINVDIVHLKTLVILFRVKMKKHFLNKEK